MRIVILLFFFFYLQSINANPIADEMDALPNYEPKNEIHDYDKLEWKTSAERLMVNEDMWTCGDGGIRQWLAYHTVALTKCERRMADINLCCSFHDDCYELHLDKFQCDLNFCNCLQKAVTDQCNGLSKHLYVDFACSAVRSTSQATESYLNRERKPFEPLYIPLLNLKGRAAYQYVYKKCQTARRALSTCAYNNLLCHSGKYAEFKESRSAAQCRDSLVTCLRHMNNELSVNTSEDCQWATEKMADMADKDLSEAWGMSDDSAK